MKKREKVKTAVIVLLSAALIFSWIYMVKSYYIRQQVTDTSRSDFSWALERLYLDIVKSPDSSEKQRIPTDIDVCVRMYQNYTNYGGYVQYINEDNDTRGMAELMSVLAQFSSAMDEGRIPLTAFDEISDDFKQVYCDMWNSEPAAALAEKLNDMYWEYSQSAA